MSYEIVDFRRHGGLKVGAGLALDDLSRANHCPVDLCELAEAACDFPLVFMKSQDTGRFRMVALMGFHAGRNVFVLSDQYVATYLPIQFARAPFALMQDETGALATSIDVNHPRSQDLSGQSLFDINGEGSAFFAKIKTQLRKMLDDQTTTSAFMTALSDENLLAPLPVDLDLVGSQHGERLEGLYSISPLKLANISDARVLEFHHNGFLAACATISASLAQFVRLQQLHNAHAGRDTSIIALRNVSVGLPE